MQELGLLPIAYEHGSGGGLCSMADKSRVSGCNLPTIGQTLETISSVFDLPLQILNRQSDDFGLGTPLFNATPF